MDDLKELMTARPRDYGVLIIAFIIACAALGLVFSGFDWILAGGFSINGAVCIAHGASHIRKRRFLWGFVFTLVGGFQVGLVTSAIIEG